jgi:hypothetical protein
MPDVELRAAEAEVIDSHQKGLFILVVEDDEETAHTTAALLQSYGHEVHLALDGGQIRRQLWGQHATRGSDRLGARG